MSKTHQHSPPSSNAPAQSGPAPEADAQDLMGNQAICGLSPELASKIAGVQGSILGLLSQLPTMTSAGAQAGASIAGADVAGLGTHGSTASGTASAVRTGIDGGYSTLDEVAAEDDQACSDPAWASADLDLGDLEWELDAAGGATLAPMTIGAAGEGSCAADVAASIDARVSELTPSVQAAADMKALVAEVGASVGPAATAAAQRIRGALDALEGETRSYVEGFARSGLGTEVLAALDGGATVDDQLPVFADGEASDQDPAALDEAAKQAGGSGPKAPGAVDTAKDVSIPKEARSGEGSSTETERDGAGAVKTDKEWKDDGSGSTTTKKGKVAVDGDGGASASASKDHAEWNADGSGKQKNTSGKVAIDKDGKVSGGASTKTETVGPDGKKTVKSASAGVDSDGNVKGSAGKGGTTADGVDYGVKGEGNVDFKMNEDGSIGIDGAGAKGTVQFGPVRVSAGAGFKDTFGVPTPSGNQWAASWSRSFTASAGGGGGNTTASGGMSAEHTRSYTGVEVFPSAEAAKAFQQSGSIPAWVPAMPEVFAPAVDDLQDGESITMSTGTDFGVDGSVSYSGVTASGGASAGTGDQVKIEKKDGKVEVTVMKLEREGVNGGVSAGVGVKGNLGRGRANHTTVSFDLSTAEGRAAYEAWAKNPSGRPSAGPGAEKVSSGSGSVTQSGKGLTAGPASAGDASEEGVYDEELSDGRKARTRYGSQETSAKAKLPVVGTLEDDKRKYGISARTVEDKDGKSETTWTLKAEVNAGTARGNSEALARAEGDKHFKDSLVDGKGSGKWTVEEEMSDDDMKTFTDKVKGGTYVPGEGTHAQGDAEELQRRLKEADGDADKERAAVAEYVANGGHDSVAGIKGCPGVEGGKRHYKLEGDKYLTGREGHARFQATLAGLRDRLADPNADTAGIAKDARALLSEAAARNSQVRNPANYPDLPSNARLEILAEITGQISEVHAFLNAVDATRRHDGDIPIVVDSDAINAAYRKMGAGRHLTEVKMQRAEVERRMLAGYGNERGTDARALWPSSQFADADSAWTAAQEAYGHAQTAEAGALALDPYGTDGSAHATALNAINAAALAFEQAAIGFANAHIKYRTLRTSAGEKSPGIVRPDKAQPLPWLPVKDPTES